MVKTIWIIFCIIVGIGIGAALVGIALESMPMAVVGGLVGAVAGWLFGRYVPILDALTDFFV